MTKQFDEWWDANEAQFMADACHMSEYHMAHVVWKAARDMPVDAIQKSLAAGEDTTGLCTVRDAVAFMFEKKSDVCEMYFQHEGKEWNVDLRILRAEESPNVELTCRQRREGEAQ